MIPLAVVTSRSWIEYTLGRLRVFKWGLEAHKYVKLAVLLGENLMILLLQFYIQYAFILNNAKSSKYYIKILIPTNVTDVLSAFY